MKFCILKNEFDDNHLHWARSCMKNGINYAVLDLTKSDWLDRIFEEDFDLFLSCPSGRELIFKTLYDERIYIIEKVLNKLVYPNYSEIMIHENKKFLSYWLKANKIAHPRTFVSYNLDESLAFAKKTKMPIVGKFSIGSSGKGVQIFRDHESLNNYITKSFKEGIRQNWGPNLNMGSFGVRLKKILIDPQRIIKRLKVYKKNYSEVQKGFVILQEYIPHVFEWRIVKIGDSFFGHQKIKQGDKASGTKGINYKVPPDNLLNYIKDICEKFQFNSMAIDLFEDENGGFLINEMQCIFGHVQEYICEQEGKPGRFIFKEDKWIFEAGLFNSNLSYDLRLENVLKILNK